MCFSSHGDFSFSCVSSIELSLHVADDFRIFCGDLGNEVNDDILARAFSRYPSFLKAKVGSFVCSSFFFSSPNKKTITKLKTNDTLLSVNKNKIKMLWIDKLF